MSLDWSRNKMGNRSRSSPLFTLIYEGVTFDCAIGLDTICRPCLLINNPLVIHVRDIVNFFGHFPKKPKHVFVAIIVILRIEDVNVPKRPSSCRSLRVRCKDYMFNAGTASQI